MKVRVFKTPTKSSPTKVALGVPEAIQTDTAIGELTLTQTEILPEATTLSSLFLQPTVVPNLPVSANRSVVETVLNPGFKLSVFPKGAKDEMVAPIEVEEVTIPEGYIHLDDVDSWDVYNYNRAYSLTDRNFDVLPGESRLPRETFWDVKVQDRNFTAKFFDPIDSVKVFYRRMSDVPEDFEWVEWSNLTSSAIEFPYYGKYVFKGVPYVGDHPLPETKEWSGIWEEPDTLSWSSIQLEPDTFEIRLEGVLGSKITEVEAFEGNKSLGTFRLSPNTDGRTETSFVLTGVSDSKVPEIEYRFMRRVRSHRSLIEKSFQILERNYADEPIELNISKEDSVFVVNIQDPKNLLYKPVNSIQPFSGQDWNTAIQTQKLLVFLEITRHQDGETRDYGRYMCNITNEREPGFLDAPPFKTKVERVDRGFSFKFEDTQEFRDVVGLDNPDLDRRLAYEFRMVVWTAGIEECLRTGSDYRYIKETPAIIRNKRTSYKYNYSVWKEEHPRKRYTGIIPVDVEYSYMLHHIRYGRLPTGLVFDSRPQVPVRTTDIQVTEGKWAVLYYYDDKEDSIVEHPFYTFEIQISAQSRLMIQNVEVSINKSDGLPISLGNWHATPSITVVDFLGYYEERKITTVNTNFEKAIEQLPNRSIPKARFKSNESVSINVNTRAKKVNADSANRQINNSIAQKVESGTIKYRITTTDINGKTRVVPLSVAISERPKMPPEPVENTSFTTGNKTVLNTTLQLPVSAVATIATQIQQAPVLKTNTIKIGKVR